MGLRRRLRIATLADIHAPCRYSVLPEIVSTVNRTSSDIVILAGDIIDRQGNEHYVKSFRDIQSKIVSIAVLGNWEYFGKTNLILLEQRYREAGIKLLVNASIDLEMMQIIGFDDWLLGRPDPNLFYKLTPGIPSVMISHCPILFDSLPTDSPSKVVMISGHTHGGQVAPFGKALITPKGSGTYVHGRYNRNDHTLFVTSGVGTSGLPLRIGAQPEILVLDLIPS